MAGAHGFFRVWVYNSATSLFVEAENFHIVNMSGDLLGIGAMDLRIYVEDSNTTLKNLLIKKALIRVTDRNTNNGTSPVSGSYFWVQDYNAREPQVTEGTDHFTYAMMCLQDGAFLEDVLLKGEDTSSATEAARVIFQRYCTAGGVTSGVVDTVGKAASSIKYRYRDDKFLSKVWDLAALVGCYIKTTRSVLSPSAVVVDFLNPTSTTVLRPDGTLGFKTSDPIAAPDAERILDIGLNAATFRSYDEVEAEAADVVLHGKGTGGTQNRANTTAAGRQVAIQDLAIFDNATAAVVTAEKQSTTPPKRAVVTLVFPKLWTSGAFNAILGDTIAIRDQTTKFLTTPFQGKWIRWEYDGIRDKITLYLNRSRYYDAEIQRRTQRNLEQLIKYGQGAQQVHGHAVIADVTTGGSGDLPLAFKVPSEFKVITGSEIVLQAEALRTTFATSSDSEGIPTDGILASSGNIGSTSYSHTPTFSSQDLNTISGLMVRVTFTNGAGAGNRDDFQLTVQMGNSGSTAIIADMFVGGLEPTADYAGAKADTVYLFFPSSFLKANGYSTIDRLVIGITSQTAGKSVTVTWFVSSVPRHTHAITRQVVNDTLTQIVANVYLDTVAGPNLIGTVTLNAGNNFRDALAIGIGAGANQLPESDAGNFHIIYVRPTSITGTTSGSATMRGQVDMKGELRI